MNASEYIIFKLGDTVSSGHLAWDEGKSVKIGYGLLAWTPNELKDLIINLLARKYHQEMDLYQEAHA